MEAKGYGTRAYRVDPLPTVAPWRHGPWTAAPLLRLRVPAQEAVGRAALGAGGEAVGRQAGRGRKLELTEAKTKPFRAALNKLNAKGTTLLVENAAKDNQNLHLSSRNLKGVEMLAGNEVHPYHLLRHEQRGVLAGGAGKAAELAEGLGAEAEEAQEVA